MSAGRVLRYAGLTLLALLFVSPLLFMISTSFKTRIESAQTPPSLLPDSPTLGAYQQILTAADTPVFRWFLNSMVAASARAVARVSEPANAGSHTCTPEWAPKAMASRSTSSAEGGPRVMTVHVPSSPARSTPLATARRSYALISSETPARSRRPSGPSRICSNSGICFTNAATRTAAVSQTGSRT